MHMQTFEGTHRFHNFASGLRAASPGLWCAPVEGAEEATPVAAAGSRGGETATTSAALEHTLQHPEKQAENQAEEQAEELTPKLLPRCLGCLQQVHEELRAIYTAATAADREAGEAAGEADLCWPLALDVLAASRNSAACRTVTRCRVGGHLALGDTEGVGGTPYLVLHVQGAAFALHQIRHIIGGAIAVAQGTVPADVMRIALHTPFQVAHCTKTCICHLSCIHPPFCIVHPPCVPCAGTVHAPCMCTRAIAG